MGTSLMSRGGIEAVRPGPSDGNWQHETCHAWVQDGDAVVIFNFRADRVVELSKALEYKDFDKFDRKRWPDVSILSKPAAAHNLK